MPAQGRAPRGTDRKKQKDKNLLTFVCLLMCCGPPVLVVGGVLVYQWWVIRSAHGQVLEDFNSAVIEWNQPSRTHAAFDTAVSSQTLAINYGRILTECL